MSTLTVEVIVCKVNVKRKTTNINNPSIVDKMKQM